MPEQPDEAPRRAVVPRQTSYKAPPASRTCADCGEPIKPGQRWFDEEHAAFGGVRMPVHEVCPNA